MSLIECSHYATEKIVMEKELLDLIKLQGIDAEFIKQDNPWY
jgi:putative NIF3 family GTP cyclohydrolase 1 type 2